jgi:hypothetical protein
MQLTRCTDQKLVTLEEFYTRTIESDEPVSREGGRTMLNLIKRLQSLSDPRRVWGLTSHYRLCLLAEDNGQSPQFVTVIASDSSNYYIEYLMPARLAPWPHAYVKGEARSEDEAVLMITIAMEKSGGWTAE